MEQLVHIKTGFIVVAFCDGKTIFYDRFLEEEMKRGISIPPFLQDRFQGKSRVRPHDKDFFKAFKEVYYTLALKSSSYEWKIIV